MLEQRDVQVSQSWQGREEKLKLRLSRGIPRRFRPSLRILTTSSPNLEIYLASIQCIVGYAIENTLKTHLSSTNQRWNWGRCRPHFSDSSRSTIRDEIFRRAFPADNNRLIIQTLIISKKWSTFQPGDDFYPLYCFISYSILDCMKQDL